MTDVADSTYETLVEKYIATANKYGDLAEKYATLLDDYETLLRRWRAQQAALQSIAANTCCDGCREAALVAKAALAKQGVEG